MIQVYVSSCGFGIRANLSLPFAPCVNLIQWYKFMSLLADWGFQHIYLLCMCSLSLCQPNSMIPFPSFYAQHMLKIINISSWKLCLYLHSFFLGSFLVYKIKRTIRRKKDFRSNKSRHCAYIIYSVKTLFFKEDILPLETFVCMSSWINDTINNRDMNEMLNSSKTKEDDLKWLESKLELRQI